MTGSDGVLLGKGAPDSGRKKDQDTRESGTLTLPKQVDGQEIQFLYGNELERCSNYGGCSCDFRADFLRWTSRTR